MPACHVDDLEAGLNGKGGIAAALAPAGPHGTQGKGSGLGVEGPSAPLLAVGA